MFCKECGAKLPEDTKFCPNCGSKTDTLGEYATKQGDLAGRGTKLVNAKCTNCGAKLEVDPNRSKAICSYCGAEFLVEQAINNYNVQVSGNMNISQATINVQGVNKENLLARAREFEEEGELDEALDYYNRVLDIDISDKDAKLGAKTVKEKIENFVYCDELIPGVFSSERKQLRKDGLYIVDSSGNEKAYYYDRMSDMRVRMGVLQFKYQGKSTIISIGGKGNKEIQEFIEKAQRGIFPPYRTIFSSNAQGKASEGGSGIDKWFDSGWFMWLMLFFIPPLGLFLLYRRRDKHRYWKVIGCIFIVWTLLFIVSPGSKKEQSSEVSKSVPATTVTTEKKTDSAKPSEISTDIGSRLAAFPANIEGMDGYLKSAIDDRYKDKTTVDITPSTNTPGGYLVEVTTESDSLDVTQSKILARNVIVAAYDAIYEKNLPAIYVSYRGESGKPNGRLFILGIGRNVADKVSRDKWNIHSGSMAFSVDDIIGFARKNQEQATTSDGKVHFENRCFMQ